MLECRIPISPRPAWINRVRLIHASLRQWYPDVLTAVYVSPDPQRVHLPSIPGIAWREVPQQAFDRWKGTRAEYLETIIARYRPPFYGDHILMLDADVMPIQQFDELFRVDAIQGVQAHHSPYGMDGWRLLFRDFGLPPPRPEVEYTGWGIMENNEAQRFGPFYPNSGMVFGPQWCFRKLAIEYFEAIEFLSGTVQDAYWFDQVAFTLGLYASGAPYRAVDARFNHPNRSAFDAAKPDVVQDLRFCHFMDESVIHRDRDFETDGVIRALCERSDLSGSNEALRIHLASAIKRMETSLA